MTGHDRVADLFTRASKLPTDERDAFLAQECGGDTALRAEVESLLGHDGSGALERAEAAVAAGVRALESDLPVPELVGDYRVIGVIGSGGMGVVYEAEQSRPQRRVALKMIRSGLATDELLRRFEHEADVLGWLDHPGIARIFEAGTADAGAGPQPYFAMELVRGEPIHRFADREQLGTPQRLELVARVAEAVHHAHQKGVVHRDLKPANVLVDESGQPKVLDFGVARVTDSDLKTTTVFTRAGELIGTLPYMSPEQVGGDPSEVDARSDVYALGVMAYELLAGQLPHDVSAVSLPEAARRIAEDEPTTLGALDSRFRGDIDVLVGKALAVEKERRYGSADELAQDIRRHLADEPIHAHKPSGAYQLAKFARRNRALVVGTGLALVALLAGTVVSTAQYLDARRGWAAERAQRELAEDHAEAADRVSEFLVDLFQVPDTSLDWGASVTARELLDRGARSIGGELLGQPRVRARLMRTMGRVYGNLGLYEDARPLLEEALAASREVGDDEQVAENLYRLATVDRLAGDYAAAEAGMREALAAIERTGGRESVAYADALNGLAGVQTLRGDLDDALSTARQAHARTVALFGAESVQVSYPLATLTAIHQERDEWTEALDSARRVLALRRAHLEPEHPDVVNAISLVGLVQFEQGDTPAALESAREVYAITTERLPADHPGRVVAMHDLASILLDNGEAREAEELLLVVLDRTRALWGDRNARYSDTLHALGTAQHELSKFAESEASLREALEIRIETLGERHLHVASTLNVLGMMLTLGPRRLEEGIELLEQALEIATEQLGGPEKATVANIMGNLANAQGYAGRIDDARRTQEQLLEVYRELRGPEHEDVARTLHNLAMIAHSQGDFEAALTYSRECREIHDAILPELHPTRAFNHDAIGRTLLELGRMEEAEVELRRSLEIREASLPEDHIHTGESLAMVGFCLMKRGEYEQAEELLLHSLSICEATYPPGHQQRRYVLARVQNLYREWGRTDDAQYFLERYESEGR